MFAKFAHRWKHLCSTVSTATLSLTEKVCHMKNIIKCYEASPHILSSTLSFLFLIISDDLCCEMFRIDCGA